MVANQEERVIKEGLANLIKGPLNVQNGKGVLTNKRFIYTKHGLAKLAVMGVLANLTKGDFEFDINLQDITEVRCYYPL